MRRRIINCICSAAALLFLGLGIASVSATAAAAGLHLSNDQNPGWKPQADGQDTETDTEVNGQDTKAEEEKQDGQDTKAEEEKQDGQDTEAEEEKQDGQDTDTAADPSGREVPKIGNGKKVPETDPFGKSGWQADTDDEIPGKQKELPGRFLKDTVLKAGAGFLAGLSAAFFIAGFRKHCNKKRKIPTDTEYQQDKDSVKAAAVPMEKSPAADCAKDSDMPAELPIRAIGKVHHVGNRRNQQDTLGTVTADLGILAVVSDGMGGLSDGEKVSRQVVKGMLEAVKHVSGQSGENPIFEMIGQTNRQVLKMLGPDQIYKSGATLVAVLVKDSGFHWASVGDSRIYFYCAHHLIQLNSEHIYKRQLFVEAVNQKISFSRAIEDLQRERLVSFLGMGEIAQIDGSLHPVRAEKGDKLLLMSDGIFNTIAETEIIRILEDTKNAEDAAARMKEKVFAAKNPKQDNFTCIILDF